MDAPPARDMPHSLEAEQGVLGSMMRDSRVIDDVLQILPHADRFHKPAHRVVYDAIRHLHEQGQTADSAAVSVVIGERKQTALLGDWSYLAVLWDAAPAPVNAAWYAKAVQEKWVLRSLIHAGGDIAKLGWEPSGPAQEMAEQAAKKLCDIEGNEASTVCTAEEAVDATAELIDRIYTQGEVGLKMGLNDLDNMTSGLHPGELILVGARPSVGKTMFGLHVARHALRQGKTVFFASLEQSREEIIMRLASAEGELNGFAIKQGTASPQRLAQFQRAMQEVRSWHLRIDDGAGQTCTRILANARKVKRQVGLELVLIDYLGLIQGEGRNQNREQEVSTISRRLKLLARELKVPTLCLAQLNRGPETRADGEPKLADFRDSGAQEQDADVVMMLWADQQTPNLVHVKIAKQRNGPVGTRDILARPDVQRFENYARY